MNDNIIQIHPPGRIKIAKAFRDLLEKKDFNAITTAEIARTGNVTEGLIYKYFKSKRDLLFQVLKECFERFIADTRNEIAPVTGAIEKLKTIIRCYLDVYDKDRVLARMLLLEVRNSADFFNSDAYKLVRMHSRTILNIIEEGILAGEIRNDIKPTAIRTALFGAIEHASLAAILFDRPIFPEERAADICRIIFDGISARGCEV